MSDRTITDKDADAIADSLAQRSPSGRVAAGRRAVNETIIGQHQKRRDQREAGFKRLFDKGEHEDEADTSAVDAALAQVRKEREEADAERERYEAERDAARREREEIEREAHTS